MWQQPGNCAATNGKDALVTLRSARCCEHANSATVPLPTARTQWSRFVPRGAIHQLAIETKVRDVAFRTVVRCKTQELPELWEHIQPREPLVEKTLRVTLSRSPCHNRCRNSSKDRSCCVRHVAESTPVTNQRARCLRSTLETDNATMKKHTAQLDDEHVPPAGGGHPLKPTTPP